MEVKHHIAIVVLLLSNISLVAQNAMRIHYKSGTEQDIPISEIDSVTFVNKATSEEDMSLTGSWLWGITPILAMITTLCMVLKP